MACRNSSNDEIEIVMSFKYVNVFISIEQTDSVS